MNLNILREFIWKYIFPAIVLIEKSSTHLLRRKRENTHNEKNNIIIIQGGLTNKGAQAMTFTAVDQIKKRFPNKNIYVFFNSDFERNIEKKNIYNFKLLPWNGRFQIRLSSFWCRIFMGNSKYDYLEKKLIKVIKNAKFMIDISGYRLSSQIGQDSWIFYLLDIIIAEKYFIPYFVFPQSIGPFNFQLIQKIYFYPLAKLYLKYPKKIYIRENDGIRYLRQFRKENIERAYDIVFQNKNYDLSNIYKEKVNFQNFQIKLNSVGVIPNIKIIERIKPNQMFSIYYLLMKKLIDSNRIIYILKHSNEDSRMCEKLKELFQNNRNVIFIPDDLNVIELENIIKKFEFIITSRYHSIVHAYKNGIPALVFGWALKYYELLKLFNQSEYYFDVKNIIDPKKIKEKLELLIQNYRNEKKEISTTLNSILKKYNCFDVLYRLA